MEHEKRTSDEAGRGIVLSTDIFPVWNFIATCLLLAASFSTLIVFSAGSGRHVPTGSVLGFQGMSYFYISGLWGLIISACWGISTSGKLKRLHLRTREDGAFILNERVIGGTRNLTIRSEDLKAILFKRYPTAGHIAWLVIAVGWLAYLVQFAIPNFQLPFLEFPAVGTTLLVFGACMVGTAVIGVSRPGLHLVIIDAVASHVIKLPGVISESSILARIMVIFRDVHLESAIEHGKHDTVEKDRQHNFVILSGACCFIILGIINFTFILIGIPSSVLNQASCWALIVSGVLVVLVFRNHANNLPANLWVSNPDNVSIVRPSHSPRFWIVFTSFIGIIITWYFVGAKIHFDLVSLTSISSSTILLGLYGALYTSWCILICSNVSLGMIVRLNDQNSIYIRTFSIGLKKFDRNSRLARSSELRSLATMVILLGGVGLAFFIMGFFSL